MEKRIVFKNADGTCGVIIPSPEWEGTLEELAAKDVPEGLDWRIIDADQLPKSRNYRNAWTDDNATETVDIDLEKAKPIQKRLAIQKAKERVPKDEWGNQDLSQVHEEVEALDFPAATTLDELYNKWPASIEQRTSPRNYPHG